MRRKDRNWQVTVGNLDTDSVVVRAKTYGAACYRAFKALKLKGKPETDYDTGGFKGVSVALVALMLALMSTQAADAQLICKNGQCRLAQPGPIRRAIFAPQARIVRTPTLASSAPPSTCSDCTAAAPEHSIVYGRRPFGYSRWYPGKLVLRATVRVGRGVARVAVAPLRFTAKAIRRGHARRAARHCW